MPSKGEKKRIGDWDYYHYTDFPRKVDALDAAKLLRADYGNAKVLDRGKGIHRRWAVYWGYRTVISRGKFKPISEAKVKMYAEIKKRLNYMG